MKIKNIKWFFIISIIIFTFASCEKNELSNIENEKNEAQFDAKSKKWIELQNKEQLVSVLNQLDNGKEITNILPISNFYSLWDLYQEIINSNESKQKQLIDKYPNIVNVTSTEDGAEVSLNLKDKTLAKLLTIDGFIKIGKCIIKVEGDVIKEISNGDETLISELEKTNNSNQNSNIIVERIISYKEKNHFEVGKQNMVAIWEGYEYYNSETRCNWEKWIDYNPVFNYAKVGAEVTNQRKSWLGWANWFSSSSYMYLHLRSDYLYCTNFSYGTSLLDDPGLDLYDSGNTTNVSVSKRFSDSGNVISGHVKINFIYRGVTYNK